MDSQKNTSTLPQTTANNDYHNCRGRLIGELIECLTQKQVCPWSSPFGNAKFCAHKNAKQFVEMVDF